MKSIKRQAGVSLVEAMVGLALSMIVTISMVGLMSNSLGSATRIIEMTQLSDELRNAMSMMTRDVRRANYSSDAIHCYANSNCGSDADLAFYDDIGISGSCFTFALDRNQDGITLNTNDGGGFRLGQSGGVGQIEMWVGGNAPDCSAGVGSTTWMPITDPGLVDVKDFSIDDSASFDGTVGSATSRTRQITLQIDGELILPDISGNPIQRTIVDTIRVRNDFIN